MLCVCTSGIFLEQTAVLQIVLNHDICHGVKDELYVAGVGGAGKVCVNFLLVATLVQTFKLHLNVCSALLVRV